ncbi:DNA topoisomerase III [Culicoidibacter larvae]|uniref:DNA topoisomerase 3 n=1 Tax=Culicoidibacter larvae TaxID=2579976 RepID=A0A5R8QFH2_9FIRM|nr:DNA topoisomerase III [Culicoidibacter larvae]TLG76544.1 DNA topoisomerase III [Culicoidibacter larvae]
MAKAVVLAEKPSVARDIARVLGCNQKGNGFLEGKQYIVTWALGHLVTLADPESYDKKYQQWKLEDLPMLPKDMRLVVIKQTTKQYHAVASQLKRNDVDSIIIATDAGREGELVARWIIEQAKVKKPIKRLWISSVTDKAIKDGFNHLQDGRKYEPLYMSAVARSEADWLVGMNATRALTTKYNAQLSSGRVQTPTLAMIAAREDEIKAFEPKNYFGLQAKAEQVLFTWQDSKTKSTQSFDAERISSLLKKLNGLPLIIQKVDKKAKKTFAANLYDLTELQRDANKKFGFSAKETLSVMQSLYEHHKVLTYPRTDSRYISDDIVPTLKDRLRSCGKAQYAKLAQQILAKPIKGGSFVNNAKVSDHHAIIPTEEPVNLAALSDRERKVYDLVVRRFLAVLLPPYEYEETSMQATIGEELFTARGQRVLALGWKQAYSGLELDDENKDATQNLPELQIGRELKPVILLETRGTTKPSAYFTEATLLSAMERPAKYMNSNDKNLISQLEQAGGIGTVATRADIIEKLFSSFVIEHQGQSIRITPKGRQLLDLAPQQLTSPLLTAQWEQKLAEIAEGKLSKDVFIRDIREYAQTLVSEIKRSDKNFKHQNISGKMCPDCGKPMLEVNGKKGKMLVCSDRECGNRQRVSQLTNARCPECHKKLELFGEGDGRIFVCKCGYREKLSAFEKRRNSEQSKKSASKGEVQKYLQKSKKAEPPKDDNPFAKAFAALKNDEE